MIKRQIITISVSFVLILALAVSYFAYFRPLIAANTPVEEAPETEEGESLGIMNRYYMYSEIERADIASIEVTNQYGTYKVIHSETDDDFYIEGYEHIALDSTMLSYLVTTCGSTLTKTKVCSNATEEKLHEYGLDKPQGSWIITDNSGKQYKVNVGRALLTGGGYYCSFVGRNAVYVIDNEAKYTILGKAEALVTPYIIFGPTSDDYYKINNFTVYKCKEKFISNENVPKSQQMSADALVENIVTYPTTYSPDTELLYTIYMSFTALTGSETYKLGVTDEDLKACGLTNPAYTVSFEYNGDLFYYYVSELNEDGYYYVISNLYSDIISLVKQEDFDYLEKDMMDWISPLIFQYYITSVSEMTVKTDDVDVTFKLHHGTDEEGNQTLAVSTSNGVSLTSEFDVNNFRQFYKTLLSFEAQDYLPESFDMNGTTVNTEEFLKDEKNCNLTFFYKNLAGETTEFKFYRYSTRRSAVSVNGVAQFYVLSDLVQKVENDALRLLNGEEIDSYGRD